MIYDKKTLDTFLATFQQSRLRFNGLMAILIISIVTTIYFLWKGPLSVVLQNIFIVVLVAWVIFLEKELTKRNTTAPPPPPMSASSRRRRRRTGDIPGP